MSCADVSSSHRSLILATVLLLLGPADSFVVEYRSSIGCDMLREHAARPRSRLPRTHAPGPCTAPNAMAMHATTSCSSCNQLLYIGCDDFDCQSHNPAHSLTHSSPRLADHMTAFRNG